MPQLLLGRAREARAGRPEPAVAAAVEESATRRAARRGMRLQHAHACADIHMSRCGRLLLCTLRVVRRSRCRCSRCRCSSEKISIEPVVIIGLVVMFRLNAACHPAHVSAGRRVEERCMLCPRLAKRRLHERVPKSARAGQHRLLRLGMRSSSIAHDCCLGTRWRRFMPCERQHASEEERHPTDEPSCCREHRVPWSAHHVEEWVRSTR